MGLLMFWTMVEKVTSWPGVTEDGASSAGNDASVNVHDAVSWEDSPVAVARNAAPRKS